MEPSMPPWILDYAALLHVFDARPNLWIFTVLTSTTPLCVPQSQIIMAVILITERR